MSELVLWEDPRTIRVYLPAARPCAACECTNPAKAQVLWVDHRAEMLWVDEICGVHLFLLQHRVEAGGGGAQFYPLDYPVPVEQIAEHIRQRKQEQMLRQQMMQQRNFVQTGGAFFQYQQTGSMNFNIRFGR